MTCIARRLGATVATAALVLAGLAASAGAVVVRDAKGHFFGLALRHGVTVSDLHGLRVPTTNSFARSVFKSDGSVDYNGGPVLHSTAPYLVFWDPSGSGITAGNQTVLKQYMSDVAADSGKATDVYSVLRQYSDTSGFADYKQTFSSAQAIVDTNPYPAVGCPTLDPAHGVTTCISDSQLQTELTSLLSARGLPTGTAANAPIYFMITPQSVNICQDSGGTICAAGPSPSFCAYHSAFVDGPSNVLYASVPFAVWAVNSTKGCQTDRLATYQSPAGTNHGDKAYQVADNLSHELSETITDPLGTAWFNTFNNNGEEVGDICATAGPNDPLGGTSPNAYLPTLGGDASPDQDLYDQLVNGNQYYNQTEWSNGDLGCQTQSSPPSGFAAAFGAPSVAATASAVSFDPTASTNGRAYSSATWNWGDGSSTFVAGTPAVVSHTYSVTGTMTVTLTLVDAAGNLSTVSHPVAIYKPPAASFTAPGVVAVGAAAVFNGSASSDPNSGGSIAGYSWNFGDGSAAGSGASPQHAYAAAGPYTVTLTVTSSEGLTGSTTRTVTVALTPHAAFSSARGPGVAGLPLSFSAAASSDPNPGGSISGYLWNFGDGQTGSGVAPSHTYAKAGTYTVGVLVSDALGLTATTSQQVVVMPQGLIKGVVVRGHTVIVTVSGPGTVKLGRKHTKLGKAGKAKFKVPAGTHRATVTFVPLYGSPQRRTVRVR